MTRLRDLSARPTVIVDPAGRGLFDPASSTRPGLDGPFGRDRVVFALPINGTGPVTLAAPIVLRDTANALVADPDGNLIGMPQVVVSRFLNARWTLDTRRLAG